MPTNRSTPAVQPEMTVERVRAQVEKWAKHHRAEEERLSKIYDDSEGLKGDLQVQHQHQAVAEAFEDIVQFIDRPPPAGLAMAVRDFKRIHGGRGR